MPMPGTPPPEVNQGIVAGDDVPSSSQGQPSLWRRILAGGLLGSAAGMAQKNPYAAPGAAVQAVTQEQQRQFENKRQQDADQRAQTQVEQQQQQIDIQKQQAMTQKQLADSNIALNNVNALHLSRLTEQLPEEMKLKKYQELSAIGTWAKSMGMEIATEVAHEDLPKFLEDAKAKGTNATAYIAVDNPIDGKTMMFQPGSNRVLTPEEAKKLSDASGVKIAAGLKADDALMIANKQMTEETELKVARFNRDTEMAKNKADNETRLQVAGIRAGSTSIKAVDKLVEKATDSDIVAKQAQDIMEEVKKTGVITGPQSAQLMSLHLANTFGTVKGMRSGMALLKYHQEARDLPQGVEAMVRKVTQGGALSMQQAQEWNGYIQQAQTDHWNEANQEAQRRGVPFKMPSYVKGASTGGGATDGLIHMTRAGKDYFVPQDKVADAEKLGATKVTQ